MITFKNIAGNKFLAVGTVQRKSALNGEKSLTGTLYDGKDVLNKLDKGWSLEFDNEPYVVTYFERNDNDNSVSFDAIHKFFWDMTKNVLYSETSGSHTIKWYFDTLFSNTGYTYSLNFNPNAVEKENWGMKNKLSLFNDIISSIGGEFEINGTLISIFQNIGTDLSTIVRYGFNLSDMTLENDTSGFVTYGEGFGAYADQENQTGERLRVTYTSPLAKIYGKLQAEPVDNQNYTISNNLLAAVKEKVDNSFSVSVQLSLYDLSVAGYPYKMANVGDWLTAVDENLDFKQRIRIISIDDVFAADGTRVSYSVSAGDVSLTNKYQKASASVDSRINTALDNAAEANNTAVHAIISADGKNTNYYLDSIDDLPTTANVGDIAFVKSGDGTVMYVYTKKSDGSFYWEKRIDPEMGEQITAGVEEAVTQATETANKLVADNAVLINQTISDVDAKANQLKAEQTLFDAKAQGYADTALSNAQANTSATAQQTAKNASDALNQAKIDITNAYKNADGVVNKRIDDTATTIGNTISQNKTASDNGISAASSKAQQALDGFTNVVTKTDFNNTNKDLNTKVSTAQQTADSANTTIGNYKTSNDGRVKATETNIKSNSDAIALTATKQELNTAKGDLNTSIGRVQINSDKVAQSVVDVNGRVNDLGQINLVSNSEFTPDLADWFIRGDASHITAPDSSSSGFNGSGHVVLDSTGKSGGDVYYTSAIFPSDTSQTNLSQSVQVRSNKTSALLYIGVVFYDVNKLALGGLRKGISVGGSWGLFINSVTLPATAKYISFDILVPATEQTRYVVSQPMMVSNTKVGAYVPGQYNNNDRVAATELTINGISDTVSNPTTGLSKRVLTAEGSLTSITDRTGKVETKATQTAAGLSDEINNRATGDNNTLASAADFTRRSISSSESSTNTLVAQTSDAILNQVGTNNLVPNSEFDPLNANWYAHPGAGNMVGAPITFSPTSSFIARNIVNGSRGIDYSGAGWIISEPMPSSAGSIISISVLAGRNDADNGPNQQLIFGLGILDANKKYIQTIGLKSIIAPVGFKEIQRYVSENITVPSGGAYVSIVFSHTTVGRDSIFQPMINIGSVSYKYSATYGTSSSSTILNLQKNNWALGIADNIGKITNGIVADTSSMSLVSKSVTIDSPQTQINGKAWIQSADIANGAIGNAQIGKAAIDDAKIANLDVSKLVGDTITGFNFNVNRSLTIASGGTINSDIVQMTKTDFMLKSNNISTTRVSANGVRVTQQGAFNIDTNIGNVYSQGTISVSDNNTNTVNRTGYFLTQYNTNNIYLSTSNYNDGSPNGYMNISSANINITQGGTGFVSDAINSTYLSANVISTTGYISADGGWKAGKLYTLGGGAIYSASGETIYFLNGKDSSRNDIAVKSVSQSSLVSLKENISKVTPEQLLSETLRADIRSYNFTGDDITDKHVTPMIDDVNHEMYIPNDWLSPEGTSVDTYSIIGYLIGSVKALQSQITELKANQ